MDIQQRLNSRSNVRSALQNATYDSTEHDANSVTCSILMQVDDDEAEEKRVPRGSALQDLLSPKSSRGGVEWSGAGVGVTPEGGSGALS
jgi:hypothetical protein